MSNDDDGRVHYLALNGHRMVTDRESYDRGERWNAQHSERCQCDGEPLPDW